MISIDVLEKYAKKKLEKTLSFEREFVFVLPNGEHETIEIPKYSDVLETITIKNIREFIINRSITQYFMVFESWIGQNVSVRPSEDPKRREALIILEFNKAHNNKGIFQFFKKEDGKIIYENKLEDLDYQHSETKFDFFKDANEIQKNIDRMIKELKK